MIRPILEKQEVSLRKVEEWAQTHRASFLALKGHSFPDVQCCFSGLDSASSWPEAEPIAALYTENNVRGSFTSNVSCFFI